jgi:hypothetical protein
MRIDQHALDCMRLCVDLTYKQMLLQDPSVAGCKCSSAQIVHKLFRGVESRDDTSINDILVTLSDCLPDLDTPGAERVLRTLYCPAQSIVESEGIAVCIPLFVWVCLVCMISLSC